MAHVQVEVVSPPAPAHAGQQRPHPADGGRARGRDDGRGEHDRSS